jgi:trk system potassium uptake protein TrkA
MKRPKSFRAKVLIRYVTFYKALNGAEHVYIVIAGAGVVGLQIARALSKEGHNIAIIDKDSGACERAEALDALVIKGNAASMSTLEEAYINSADIFIGVTGSDEINMLSCGIAKIRGCRTIARVNGLDYINEPISVEKLRDIGVDTAVCPELVAAIKMARILAIPSMLETSLFAGGRVQVIDSRVDRSAPVVGRPLRKIPFPEMCNVVAIFRDAEVIIPGGSDIFVPNDRVVSILGRADAIPRIEQLFGSQEQVEVGEAVRRVMIVGATRIGIHLARLLQERNMSVVLIDDSEERCQEASERLSNVLVIHGSGSDKDVLLEEGVAEVDAFLATTTHEEFNVLCCLLAKQQGAKKTIALIDRPELKSILEDMGVDLAVSPMMATVSSILQYARKSEVLSLSVLHGGEAQVIELKVTEKSKVAGKKLKKARFPKNSLVGAVVRNDKVFIPRGDFQVQVDDRLIVFARSDIIQKVEKLFF